MDRAGFNGPMERVQKIQYHPHRRPPPNNYECGKPLIKHQQQGNIEKKSISAENEVSMHLTNFKASVSKRKIVHNSID